MSGLMKIVVPQGCYGGQRIRVNTPEGQLVEVELPPGVTPGQQLTISIGGGGHMPPPGHRPGNHMPPPSHGPVHMPPPSHKPDKKKNKKDKKKEKKDKKKDKHKHGKPPKHGPPQQKDYGYANPVMPPPNYSQAPQMQSNFNQYTPSAPQLVAIVVPRGLKGGDSLTMKTPDGQMIQARLPNYAYEGMNLKYDMRTRQFADDSVPVAEPIITPSAPNSYDFKMQQSDFSSIGGVPMAATMNSGTSAQKPFPSWWNYKAEKYKKLPYGVRKVQAGLPPPQLSGRKKALLIGINYPGTRAALRGCINDVNALQQFLMKQGWQNSAETMVCLKDNVPSKDFQPTYKNIMKGLNWLVAGASPGDILFFHFSGHGAQVTDHTGHEKDGLNETICPSDFQKSGMITDDEIWDIMVSKVARGVRLVALMDCCHCGTGMDLSFNWKNHSRWDAEPNPSFTEGDITLFSGCDDHQTSADAYNKLAKSAGGAMTTSFIQCWERNPQQSVQKFMYDLHSDIKRRGFDQVPQLSASQRWDPNKRTLDMQGEIFSNYNEEIGKQVNIKFKPQKPNFGNSPLGPMLLAAGFAVLVAPELLSTGAEVAGGVADLAGDGIGELIGGGLGSLMGSFFDF